ncbi:glycosyltransferase family 4 protein [uncultured Roseibium sp.]|uniref:glycosyltransferase family 4 protein n=1 Tax=uncultured Roseibium sp. TaxID=1936171 RepID=UPI003217CF1B
MPIEPVNIAIVLPRGMHFGPDRATAIDLCVRDFVAHSRYRSTTTVIGEALADPFADISFQGVSRDPGDSQKRFVRKLADRAKDCRPNLVVVHQHLSSAMTIRKDFPDIPVLLHKHNTPKIGSGFIKKQLDRRRYNAFDHLIFVSDFSRENFLGSLPGLGGKSSTVHNGLDLTSWTPAKKRDDTVLFAGRAVPDKGVLEAAQAVATVLAEQGGWRTRFILSTLATDEAYIDRIKSLLAPLGDRAEVCFDQPHSAVQEAFETAAITLVPSLFEEPFGRTAIEAMAGGSALLTSGRGGLRETTTDAALWIDPTNERDFAGALSLLMKDESLRGRLAQAGAQRVRESFSIQVLSARLDSLYEDVLSRHRTTGL